MSAKKEKMMAMRKEKRSDLCRWIATSVAPLLGFVPEAISRWLDEGGECKGPLAALGAVRAEAWAKAEEAIAAGASVPPALRAVTAGAAIEAALRGRLEDAAFWAVLLGVLTREQVIARRREAAASQPSRFSLVREAEANMRRHAERARALEFSLPSSARLSSQSAAAARRVFRHWLQVEEDRLEMIEADGLAIEARLGGRK